MENIDEEVLQMFIEESQEHLADIEPDLLLIEERGENIDIELVNKVFRAAHSIKGGAGFLDLGKIQEVSHKAENVLDMIRSYQITPNPEIVNILLLAFDKLREMINNHKESDQTDISEVLVSLSRIASSKPPKEEKETSEKEVEIKTEEKEPVEKEVEIKTNDVEETLNPENKTNLSEKNNKSITENNVACEPEKIVPTKKSPQSSVNNSKEEAPKKSSSESNQTESSLRVKVELLESLMNLAGELVLCRNQLIEAIAQKDQHSLQASAQQVNLVTSELQEAIMLTRMQSIDRIFNKFPRVVRDLAKQLGKKVNLNIQGKEVEMDKTIIEGLSDPLTHMIRNAVDHGIEPSDVRANINKNPVGTINLKAYHQAGHMVVEISDDGKGLDPDKIASSAIAKGLISEDKVTAMSEKEKLDLILLPGLSTAENISNVSGRGVGMDVVKINLEKLGGKIDIESKIDKGSCFRIKLPLTLAIIPSLLVSVGQERFAIPQINVNELIRIRPSQVKDRIEQVGEAAVLNLRGSLIPLVYLADVLGISKTYLDPCNFERKTERRLLIADRRSKKRSLQEEESIDNEIIDQEELTGQKEQRVSSDRRYHADSDLNIVIATIEDFEYGLIVENLHDTIEIVVKPLGQHLKTTKEYAGATIMGDGRVALILDIAKIAEIGGLLMHSESALSKKSSDDHTTKIKKDIQSFLLFKNSIDEHCAVLLDLVRRIEYINASDIEILAGKKILQYRDTNLPLVALNDVADVNKIADEQQLVVIVFKIYNRDVGLLAARPIDVIETSAAIDQSTLKQTGIMGSSIIKERTTMILDIFDLVEAIYPEWVNKNNLATLTTDGKAPSILLAEDSTFFRNQVKKFIEECGYMVIAAEDGQEAWELLQEKADTIRLLVTDIEMPRLDGYALSRTIKEDSRFSNLPIIAVTTRAGNDDIAKGKSAGIDDYQIKLDKEKLLASISSYLQVKG